ncbi:MAG: ABC transporter permease, partial [Gammaproteobacteria bacterium]
NSLLADEPEHQALVPEFMDRAFMVPSRPEMEKGLAAFAERVPVRVRYGCRWEATRRDDDGRLVLTTSDGEYRCKAAVFAVGVTRPWRSPIPGIEHVPHYVDCQEPSHYRGRSVFVVGKRNSGFEIADGLLPWARQVILGSPRPVQTSVVALSTVRVRYLQPYEDYGLGGGTFAVDLAVERIEHRGERWGVVGQGTTRPGPIDLEVDDVIAATGFSAPLLDLPSLGVRTVAQGRIPALTPFWESAPGSGIYFAGNATQGAAGLRKHGVGASSAAVHGFRYNARLMARQLAETHLGAEVPRERVQGDVVPYLLAEAARARELALDAQASQVVDVVRSARSAEELERMLVRGEIAVGIVIPHDFEARVARGEGPPAQLLVDGADPILFGSARALAELPLHVASQPPPRAFELRPYFNPERRSPVFIVPGLCGVILTLTMVLFTAVAIVRERERGNLEMLITTPIRTLELMLGKILPYIAIGFVQVTLILLLATLLFRVPIRGSLTDFYAGAGVFIAATLTLGLLISTLA